MLAMLSLYSYRNPPRRCLESSRGVEGEGDVVVNRRISAHGRPFDESMNLDRAIEQGWWI
jgi:hypothetical protein